ncbi:hypothetical protein Pmani_019829 [Petrolisthes manimaculis]|uniref:Uncharacterized protein n=1 Tax=Petrolisthes manimaculis TaxID=1843537 RepID=A0AAE1PHR6_9EUCA|nr:hypothetical protein Pmani_019829 [Petrolisthes manimaculis]
MGDLQLFNIPTALLTGELGLIPSALLTANTVAGGAQALLAATGLVVIEIATILGFIFNYIDQAQKSNEAFREEAAGGGGHDEEAEKSDNIYPSWLVEPRPPKIKRNQDTRRQGRSISESALPPPPSSSPSTTLFQNAGNVMVSALSSLDSLGCLNKLMCHFNSKKSANLTPREHVMVHLFSGKIPKSSKVDCTQMFQQCPFEMRMRAWVCVGVVVAWAGVTCDTLAIIPRPGIPLVGGLGAAGTIPIVSLVALEVAVLVGLLKSGLRYKQIDELIDYWNYKKDDYSDYDYSFIEVPHHYGSSYPPIQQQQQHHSPQPGHHRRRSQQRPQQHKQKQPQQQQFLRPYRGVDSTPSRRQQHKRSAGGGGELFLVSQHKGGNGGSEVRVDVVEMGEGVYGWQRDVNEEMDDAVPSVVVVDGDSVEREGVDEGVEEYLRSVYEEAQQREGVDANVYEYLDLYDEANVEDEEELMDLIISRMDTDECLLKLYCNLQRRPSITLEQQLLSQLFSTSQRARTTYNDAFSRAQEVLDTRDGKPLTCEQVFSKCDLNEDTLEDLLRITWQHHENVQQA